MKFLSFLKSLKPEKSNKKVVLKTGAVVMCCLALVAINISFDRIAEAASGTKRQIPIYRVAREDNKASISFDAAWGNEDTKQLIDILQKYDVKATFFVVGQWVDKYPESVKALSDAGHEIMSHSDTHPHMPQLSAENMRAEIRNTADKIEKITGAKPTLFRPPYGDYNNMLIDVLREEGVYCIQWDVDSLDWKDLPSEEIATRVIGKMKPGSIALFHNAAKNTPASLPAILEAMKEKGIELVPISELIYYENYQINHAGEQQLKAAPPKDAENSTPTEGTPKENPEEKAYDAPLNPFYR